LTSKPKAFCHVGFFIFARCRGVTAGPLLGEQADGGTMTRQRRDQLANRALGLCELCRAPRNAYASLGDCCARQRQEYMRRVTGSKPHRKGGPGRPPKLVSQ
jgi:hypothetical protein